MGSGNEVAIRNAALGTLWNRRLFGLLGDSITANNHNYTAVAVGDGSSGAGTSGVDSFRNDGFITWARIFSYQKFSAPRSLNYGNSGDTTTDIIARLSTFTNAVIAANAGCTTVLAGTNDITAGATAATIIANLNTIYTTLTNLGIWVFAIPITPRGSGNALDSTTMHKLASVNRWIRAQEATNPLIYVCDATKFLTDTTSATGDCITALFADGLHPAKGAACYMGSAISQKYNILVPTVWNDFVYFSQADIYSSTLNPNGNLLTNGLMAGSGGSTSTGGTGTVATSWKIAADSSSGISTLLGTGSKVTRSTPDGGEVQRITMSGTATSDREIILQQETVISTSNYTTGDVIYGGIEFSIPVGLVGVTGIELRGPRQVFNTSKTQMARDGQPDTSTSLFIPTMPMVGTLLTPAITIVAPGSAGSLNFWAGIQCKANIAASGVIDFGRAFMRKV